MPIVSCGRASRAKWTPLIRAVYHGEEAEWLKLQALQLMLRFQVKELRQIWGLPEVLEVGRHLPA